MLSITIITIRLYYLLITKGVGSIFLREVGKKVPGYFFYNIFLKKQV